ncbi:MAG TPA: heme-binding domain-containing protein [Longimicrobiales bacterium]|nr:heme-binding domain-containing protein [Longimicrobiales bacterium]
MDKKRIVTYVVIGLIVVFAVIQLIPGGAMINPPVTGEVQAPAAVMQVMKTSCYDCHSNETTWPWYSHVAPVSWLVRRDVNEGRRHLNFSTWAGASDRRKAHRLRDDIPHQLDEHEMPLWYYTIIHRNAVLTNDQRATLRQWALDEAKQYPDSLFQRRPRPGVAGEH